MSGLIQGLEIARRALVAHQAALNVTGNNISNVNTKGYSRQRAVLTPSPAERTPDGYIGTGVDMSSVMRVRDNFIDTQIREEMGLSGQWQARSEALAQVETAMNEPSDGGLGQLLDQFWNSWQDLSDQPESSTARVAVVGAGQDLADGLNSTASRLGHIASATSAGIVSTVNQANEYLRELGDLNARITGAESGGKEAPDLRDRRDLVVDSLADLTGATHTVRADGSVFVRIGGRKVVDGSEVQLLAATNPTPNAKGAIDVTFASDSTSLSSPGGRLGGLLEVRNQDIPDLAAQIDTLAAALSQSVNRIHLAGPSRLPFFQGETAAAIAVAPELSADPTQVNAGSTGDAGDNDIALAMTALRDARVLSRGTATLSDFYNTQISTLGANAQQANRASDNQSAAVTSLEARRQAAVGVNLDEELTNLVTTQKAYEAAARVFSTVSKMIDDLFNM